MVDHPNARLARRCWQAVSEGDVAALAMLWDEKLVWHATGGSPWRGDHRGREDVLDFLATLGERSDIDASLVDVLASETRFLIFFHVSMRREERRAEVDYACMGRVENGLIAEMWTFPFDVDAVAGFWEGVA